MNSISVGSVDGAYFVPRGELLQWVNATCQMNLIKIEDLCTGAIYCKLFNEYMPGKIQTSKVNWNAKTDYEYICNFKILQQGFAKCNIQKSLEIEKLIKGKFQDNLEMLQWMKKHFDNSYAGATIRDRRAPTPTPRPKIRSERSSTEKNKSQSRNSAGMSKFQEKITKELGNRDEASPFKKNDTIAKISNNESAEVLDNSKITMDTLKKERDFYFEKLREIEIQVQDYPERECELVRKIQAILYSEDISIN